MVLSFNISRSNATIGKNRVESRRKEEEQVSKVRGVVELLIVVEKVFR